ncbi:MAG TPA: ATP-binding protein, partial [Thermoanaerobaculia bacterium]|nr:ATP-binding protein [Thermoanaerobaculia bacterium]
LVHGAAVPLAPAADVTAYRVIQESLTNVCKHSRRRRARLTLGYQRRELRITVEDLGTGDPAVAEDPLPAGGQGIVGMRERLLALGGRFTAGPRPGGGFLVDASLPYQPADIAKPADITPPHDCPAPLDEAGRRARPTMEPLP